MGNEANSPGWRGRIQYVRDQQGRTLILELYEIFVRWNVTLAVYEDEDS
jgi:hypothetical protein